MKNHDLKVLIAKHEKEAERCFQRAQKLTDKQREHTVQAQKYLKMLTEAV